MRYKEISESTVSNYSVVTNTIDYLIYMMPKIIGEDDKVYIEYSLPSLKIYSKSNKLDNDEYEQIVSILSKLDYIIILNLEKTISDTSMGHVRTMGTTQTLVINLSGLMGNSNKKSKDEILSFKGTRSVQSFRSILGHELRHLVQHNEYSDKLKSPNDDDYNYHTDPLEIDASFMESLLDHDIDHYNNAQDYTNAVMDSFKKKKPISEKTFKIYYRKAAKFFAMYKSGVPKVLTLKDKFDAHRKQKNQEFLDDYDNAVAIIKKNFTDRIKNDFEKLNGIPKDDRQSYYMNIEKADVIRNMIVRIIDNNITSSGNNNIHLLVSTIAYAHSVKSIRHCSKVIKKLYSLSEQSLTIKDTIRYIEENGYFNKEAKYVVPMIDSLKSIE